MDHTKERTSASGGLEPGPVLPGKSWVTDFSGCLRGSVRLCGGDRGRFPRDGDPIPPSLLRNSDEQTIAGLCAVFTAIESMRWPRDRYEGWGVVAASRFLGRANLARALQSFLAEGVWGTSPHLIPHFRSSFRLGDHQPGPRLARAESRRGGRAARDRRGVSGWP